MNLPGLFGQLLNNSELKEFQFRKDTFIGLNVLINALLVCFDLTMKNSHHHTKIRAGEPRESTASHFPQTAPAQLDTILLGEKNW